LSPAFTQIVALQAVLNDTLEDAFRYRHPGFRPANDDHRAMTAAA